VVTNIHLHGFGISDSNLCSFCNLNPETTIHLFLNFQLVECFWNDVISWICHCFKRNIDVSNFNKLYGFEMFENSNVTKLLNCFLLNARFLIYTHKSHKYEKSKPTVAAFIRIINCVKIIEKCIAKKNRKLKQHFEKWNSV